MSDNLYKELKKISDEDERLKLVIQEIKNIMESKKNRTFAQNLINKKRETQPKGWD
ncbi:hypothetical protein O9H85_35135 [Paenibacillus filicis]|uniref:Uncharacterized protein n=1 Tax=Paenibacillus gyeongsangnamensis TaxID=3388067 RepID=A0ABT4QKU2_9BACL|nr:hypothetical protein [Paenibacillus filicis]MCZ8517485.1 hypothetical protein [Paenibacillus filicis]